MKTRYDYAINKYRHRFIDEHFKGMQISRGEAPFLIKLLNANGEIPMNELIERTFFHKSHVTRSIAKLVEDGYILKEKNPSDGRSYILKITDTGILVAKEAQAIFDKWNNMTESCISEEEKKVLEDITVRIYHKFREYYNEEDTIDETSL